MQLNSASGPAWNDLQVFLVLARRLHFGRAAVELGVSQPHVSRRLKALEDALGVRLVYRTSRTVELTPEGERLRAELVALEDLLGDLAAQGGDRAVPPPAGADLGRLRQGPGPVPGR